MTRRIVITGAASGIGRATARRLERDGVEVIGVDLHDTDVLADLSTPGGRAGAVEAVTTRLDGTLDGLVACAGISAESPDTVSVNYFGTVELATDLRGLLAASEAPRVVVMSSVTATYPVDDDVVGHCLAGDEPAARKRASAIAEAAQGWSLYPSSKHALARWVRRTSVSAGWAEAGIALNAAAPGTVVTPMTEPIIEDPEMKELMDGAVPMPLNGYAEPDTVADLLRWLVSAANTHVTGQIIFVDGGADATIRDDLSW